MPTARIERAEACPRAAEIAPCRYRVLADWLNSNSTRAVGYVVAAVASVFAGLRERSGPARREASVWPAFWFVTAALLFVMALGRVLDVEKLVTGFGRSRARSGGWYGVRRFGQQAMIGAVTAIWTVVAYVAIGRVMERRRRYLAPALVVSGLSLFAAVRFVSLHWVDSVLYRRSIANVRVAAIIELGLIALAIVTTRWHPSPRRWQQDAAPPTMGEPHDVTRRS